MRERVEKVTDCGSQVWVSTFHSTCVRILRRYIDRIGYQTNFTIYDTDDQKSVIRDACKKLNIDTKMLKERTIMSAISSAKDEMISPDEMEANAGGDYNAKSSVFVVSFKLCLLSPINQAQRSLSFQSFFRLSGSSSTNLTYWLMIEKAVCSAS